MSPNKMFLLTFFPHIFWILIIFNGKTWSNNWIGYEESEQKLVPDLLILQKWEYNET